MKKYEFKYDKFRDPAPRVREDGEWVRHEDVKPLESELTRLKELNREMKELNRDLVEALENIQFEWHEYGRIMGKETIKRMNDVLTKAERRGEGE